MAHNELTFNRLLVANRGEIAVRILRAASELGIQTVAIYTFEDRYSLHRYKADEAYQIGADDDPLKPYLDIEQIIELAKKQNIDAIHPGYGFLSENVTFASRCQEAGITFIGPRPEVMRQLGDKVAAKAIARAASVPVIEDSQEPLTSVEVALKEARRIGFPVMIKAASGGGGRGMRIAENEQALKQHFEEARGEAAKAFGDDTVFLEKFIAEPKHIEVQIMADNHGNRIHLYERDCSVQRRFQKVVEVAPSMLPKHICQQLYDYALAITGHVNYNNVGTVEFLVDTDHNIYFIEVNPRIQVEHTITEEITGIDIVRSQIRIAQGARLSDQGIRIGSQLEVRRTGFAIQCRITTEDPRDNFRPDYGTVIHYRNASGFGIRLDEGSSYPGVRISPFFDSMLVKVSARSRSLRGASQRMARALREFRIRGVKTNIGFLQQVIKHPEFANGNATVNFIKKHYDELLRFNLNKDRGTKTLRYIADITINGNPDVRFTLPDKQFRTPKVPAYTPPAQDAQRPQGTKDQLMAMGPQAFAQQIKQDKLVHYTDTTLRDAHQSLLATRMRTYDMLKVTEGFAANHAQLFSMEMWGGATFDVCMRFLHESPWHRLNQLREAAPHVLFQMLLRGSNAVGYKAYPDNLIEAFVEEAWNDGQGIDVFRVFDSLNWIDNMKVAIKAVLERTNALVEGTVCYTGHVLNTQNNKYSLQYYVDQAKRLEDEGVHILAIKDMAGLLKPQAATVLIEALKKAVDIPLHLHTHDTSSIQSATYLKAIEAGVDIVDVALGGLSGLTSQPNFNSVVAMMEDYPERHRPFDLESLNAYSNYWEAVRDYYYPFESELRAGSAEVYEHEIPGGQYSNLPTQARALGLESRFDEVKNNYAVVNKLFGDIIKVTPSSKVVGDMALYMTSNGLTPEDILDPKTQLAVPESVVSMFKGELGQPFGGWPEKLSQIVLKGEQPFTEKPNAHLDPIDIDTEIEAFHQEFPVLSRQVIDAPKGTYENLEDIPAKDRRKDFLSYKLYPKVFTDLYNFRKEYGDLWYLPSPTFFYGMQPGQEIIIQIAPGKDIIIKLNHFTEPDEEGMCTVSFEMNGQTRRIQVKNHKVQSTKKTNVKVSDPNHVGAPLQGRIASVAVALGQTVQENDPLFVIEAMKMESTVSAPKAGTVSNIVLNAGDMVEQDDLVIELQ